MTTTDTDNPRSPITGLRSRGPDISRKAKDQFAVANASELRVGTRVQVWTGAISRVGGKHGRIVACIGDVYRVLADDGAVGVVSRLDLALEKR